MEEAARILIAGKPDGFGKMISNVITEHLRQKYACRVTFAVYADELLKLARSRVFDVFIVIADSISFGAENSSPFPEKQAEMVLELIRHLKRLHHIPVLTLHGHGDTDFGEKIDAADLSLKYPRIFDELRAAVQGIFEGKFDEKAAERRKLVSGRSRGTVLIVDDDAAFCLVCKAFLESTGFKSHMAHSAAQAVSILKKIKTDILITSLLFAGLSRHYLTPLIKHRFNADVIILANSTEARGRDRENSAGNLLYKPVSASELQDSVERTMRRRHLEKFRQKYGYAGQKIRRADKQPFSKTEYFLSGGRYAAAIIPEEEGLGLMEKLASHRREFEIWPHEPDEREALLPDTQKRCDPNRLLEVFDRLRLMDGCTLDYYLNRFNGFCLPHVYDRRTDSAPVNSHGEFIERFPYRRDRFRHIAVEPSPSGYFQFAVFYNAACQFHLWRHCRFGLTRPVITEKQLKDSLDFISGESRRKEFLKKYSTKPRLGVLACEDLVKVIFIAFNPFQGLYYLHTYIRSNVIEHVDRSKILECDSSFGF
jgi:DNA-binding response OmpR family regulator